MPKNKINTVGMIGVSLAASAKEGIAFTILVDLPLSILKDPLLACSIICNEFYNKFGYAFTFIPFWLAIVIVLHHCVVLK